MKSIIIKLEEILTAFFLVSGTSINIKRITFVLAIDVFQSIQF